MIVRIISILTMIMVITAIILGFWYLMNPETWNWQSLSRRDIPETSNPGAREITASLDDNTLVSEYAPARSCTRTPTSSVSPVSGRPIYRWVDENGVISFGNNPPATGNYELYNPDTPDRMDYFRLRLDLRNQVVIPFFQRRVEANVTGIYRVLSGLVSEENLRRVELNVRVFPNRSSYLDYSDTVTGNRLSNTGGFYSPDRNEAVTYRYADDEFTLAVTQHESLHVIVQGIFGIAPEWLNEGLAEYFENLSVTGQVTRVDADETSLVLARNALNAGYAANLFEFFNMPGNDWYSSDQPVNYALGWSMVYFLMSSNEGKFALSSLLEELAINYCNSVDSYVILSRFYPGGIARFERDYRIWISSGNKQPHIY